MWSPDYYFPFVDEKPLEYGVEEFFAMFFDNEGDPLPSAPQELKDEVAAMRGDEELLKRYYVGPVEATA